MTLDFLAVMILEPVPKSGNKLPGFPTSRCPSPILPLCLRDVSFTAGQSSLRMAAGSVCAVSVAVCVAAPFGGVPKVRQRSL